MSRLSYVGVSRHEDRHLMEAFAVALLRLCRQLVGREDRAACGEFRAPSFRRSKNPAHFGLRGQLRRL